ncbi:helix-turn-helix protein [Chitinophaga skermanii]|uniref:Helix-turn-helix protein n=1 Tax=Chitinophaga skermanii TaxID=331697 RepID=A0A327Q9D1_9BACT|nr:helix-turn-helix domain-containing protein [Chitinophaga skermanii]RAJ00418.1 helix-turn-helix protein [Chitinophaga skermanii]
MELKEKILLARKQKGLTQEELAELTNINVRTIQRIENGETTPRVFTLKTLAAALSIPFETLVTPVPSASIQDEKVDARVLEKVHLACYAYLVLPLIHWVVPMLVLKFSNTNHLTKEAGNKIVRQQIFWVVTVTFVMLFTVMLNFILVYYWGIRHAIHYLIPAFTMYILHAVRLYRQGKEIVKY